MNIQDIRPDDVVINLGGRNRTVQFDLNAFAELEKKFGSVEKAMNELVKGRMTDIRFILWAGLIHDEAVIDETTGEPIKYNITPYQVGGWIKNPSLLNEASAKVSQAMSAGMPNPEAMVKAAKDAGVELPEGVAKTVLTEEEKAEQEKNG